MSKKIISAFSMLAVLTVGANVANAASTGTITFNGELTDSTCDVDVNGQGPDATVVLPTISTNLLTAPGQIQGRTSFNMSLTGCTVADGKSTVSAFFQPGSTVDLSTGRLLNVSGTATNVGLQLLDASNGFAPINVGNTNQVSDTAYVDMSSGSAVLPYAVEYYADDATTAGTVVSSVVYNLQYK